MMGVNPRILDRITADVVNITADSFLRVLSAMLPEQRADVIKKLRFNTTFCGACGYDMPGRNPRCYCENDE